MGDRILLLNYPEPGRFAIFEADKKFYEIEGVLNWLKDPENLLEKIILEANDEMRFDWWVVDGEDEG
jgi:hypothetical protein